MKSTKFLIAGGIIIALLLILYFSGAFGTLSVLNSNFGYQLLEDKVFDTKAECQKTALEWEYPRSTLSTFTGISLGYYRTSCFEVNEKQHDATGWVFIAVDKVNYMDEGFQQLAMLADWSEELGYCPTNPNAPIYKYDMGACNNEVEQVICEKIDNSCEIIIEEGILDSGADCLAEVAIANSQCNDQINEIKSQLSDSSCDTTQISALNNGDTKQDYTTYYYIAGILVALILILVIVIWWRKK